MKNLLVLALVSQIWLGCSNDEPNPVQLPIQSFEMNENCFSSQSLQQMEVVITNAEEYQAFENSIRRHFIESCDTTHFPPIDFDSSFFVGKYTQTSGCSFSYESNVLFQANQSLYTYIITVTSVGTCEMLHTAFNCAIIPRRSEQINVQMQVENQQQ
jgi:hypothetical protein